MVWLGRLVAGAGGGVTLAQQAVVLDIVGRGQLPPGDEVVDGQEGQQAPAQPGDQRPLQRGRDGVGLQHGVAPVPARTPQLRQALRLQRPGATDATGQLAPCKVVDRLAHAGTGVVLGRGHPAVMAAAVFDREMPVGWHGQCQPCQPLFQGIVLVAELVRGIQPQAGIGAGDIRQQQEGPPREILRARPPGATDQGQEVQRHRGPGQPAVVAIGVELPHDDIGRVVRVLADEGVQERHQAVADQQRQRQRGFDAGGVVRGQAHEGHEGPEHRQHPCPALAVAVADFEAVGRGGDVGDGHAGGSRRGAGALGRCPQVP